MDALRIATSRLVNYGDRETAAEVTRQEIANLRGQGDPAGRIPVLDEVLSHLSAHVYGDGSNHKRDWRQPK